MKLDFNHHVTVLAFLIGLLCSICAAGPIDKRQGLFLCSGWGASCASGWRYPQSEPKQTFRQRSRTKGNQSRSLRQYWLTTENTWGPPVGKRSDIERASLLIKELLRQRQSKTDF